MPKTSEQSRRQLAFGARVRQLRLAAELTQQDLAHASGLDRTYIGSVERGHRNPTLGAMWRLAEALTVTPASFFEPEGAER